MLKRHRKKKTTLVVLRKFWTKQRSIRSDNGICDFKLRSFELFSSFSKSILHKRDMKKTNNGTFASWFYKNFSTVINLSNNKKPFKNRIVKSTSHIYLIIFLHMSCRNVSVIHCLYYADSRLTLYTFKNISKIKNFLGICCR